MIENIFRLFMLIAFTPFAIFVSALYGISIGVFWLYAIVDRVAAIIFKR